VSSKNIGMGLVGPGFIAPHHLDAVRRLGNVDVVALAASSLASATRKARDLNVPRFYGHYSELLRDPAINVVHNTTPNYLHYEVTLAALRAGKHVISDKPLATDSSQSRELVEAASASGLANVVTFNYRGNPVVQHARALIAQGELGAPVFIHGHYLQDWMTDANVYSWRSDPKRGGVSSALADIGSHWCDLAEHVSGARIIEVLADLTTVVRTRYSSGASAEAFAASYERARTAIQVQSEDVGSVLLRFDNGARGCFSVGQVLPGNKNNLRLEINGRHASVRWSQERQNELWLGRHDESNSEITKDPAVLNAAAYPYVSLPAGHQQGWSDAFRNVIADAYQWVREGGAAQAKPARIASFADGYRSSCLIEAMLQSNARGGVWQTVDPSAR
jgi:predicted dehydrogenase